MHVITAEAWIVRNANGTREGFLRYLPEGDYAEEQVIQLDLTGGRLFMRAAKAQLSDLGYHTVNETYAGNNIHRLTAVKR